MLGVRSIHFVIGLQFALIGSAYTAECSAPWWACEMRLGKLGVPRDLGGNVRARHVRAADRTSAVREQTEALHVEHVERNRELQAARDPRPRRVAGNCWLCVREPGEIRRPLWRRRHRRSTAQRKGSPLLPWIE